MTFLEVLDKHAPLIVDPSTEIVDITLTGVMLRVTWPQGCKKFKDYVAVARTLKQTLSARGYDGAGGWLYPMNHAATVLAAFPNHKTSAEVKALANKGKAIAVDMEKKGEIALQGGKVLVQFRPKGQAEFDSYVTRCRLVKQKCGEGIYHKHFNGWLYPVHAIEIICSVFSDFLVSPAIQELRQKQKPVVVKQDDRTDALLDAAADLLDD